MRIVAVPGGTQQQFRAVTMTTPFDLAFGNPVATTTFLRFPRSLLYQAGGTVGQVWVPGTGD